MKNYMIKCNKCEYIIIINSETANPNNIIKCPNCNTIGFVKEEFIVLNKELNQTKDMEMKSIW